jgi:hydrogenase maturation protein HypF
MGYGTDGTLWGGEILVADIARFERVASLRPLRLAGGDRAIKQVWRIALALLDDAFEGDPPIDRLPVFDNVPPGEIRLVRQMIASELNAPLASGAGRYFDAFGALGLGRPSASFEGQVAMAWEQAADPSETRPYPFAIDTASPLWRLDLRSTARVAIDELLSGRAVSSIAARFHETLVAATADIVWTIVRARGAMPVVLTGGCFQNIRLTESLARSLGAGLAVHVSGQVPSGDGGIALGQLMIADAILCNPSPQGGVPCASAFPEK